uniref:CheR family methyltransferase n=1 Tax=Aetokthonos hydrillicola TaxID=1550245 RepID=UPI001ABA6179
MTSKETNPELENLLEYIKANRGFDFKNYKRTSLSRRIGKRMQFLGLESYSEFLDYLEVHPDEFVKLFNIILINVTAFFRDPEAWQYVANEIMPRIVAQKHPNKPIRVWSAGCASGEETYSVAMLLAEALGMEQYSSRVKVFATDVDVEALNHARQGNYSVKDVQGVPHNLLEKYFEQVNGVYTVQKELRRCVIFGRHNLAQDAPISRIDLLICRNTLIYLNTETQSKILDRFHFALNDAGFLFLGKAEMLFTRNHYFIPIDLRLRVFTKNSHGDMRDLLFNMVQLQNQQPALEMEDQVWIHEAAFEIDPVAQIVVDLNNSVLLANFQAQTLFNIHPKDLGRPLQELELFYRPVELGSVIEQVHKSCRAVTLKDIEWF